MKYNTKRLALCGILAAVYCALTVLTAPLAYGPIQFRAAEALCIFPFFAPYTGLGLFVGCVLSNLFSTVTALDIVVGSAATLLASLWTARCRHLFLAWIPTVLFNAVMVGGMLAFVMTPEAFWHGFCLMSAQIAVGESAVMLVFGMPLACLLRRRGWDEVLRKL